MGFKVFVVCLCWNEFFCIFFKNVRGSFRPHRNFERRFSRIFGGSQKILYKPSALSHRTLKLYICKRVDSSALPSWLIKFHYTVILPRSDICNWLERLSKPNKNEKFTLWWCCCCFFTTQMYIQSVQLWHLYCNRFLIFPWFFFFWNRCNPLIYAYITAVNVSTHNFLVEFPNLAHDLSLWSWWIFNSRYSLFFSLFSLSSSLSSLLKH